METTVFLEQEGGGPGGPQGLVTGVRRPHYTTGVPRTHRRLSWVEVVRVSPWRPVKGGGRLHEGEGVGRVVVPKTTTPRVGVEHSSLQRPL